DACHLSVALRSIYLRPLATSELVFAGRKGDDARVARRHRRLGLVSFCRRRRVRSASAARPLVANQWLVRHAVRPRRVSVDWAAVAKIPSPGDFGVATVRRGRAPRVLRPHGIDGLASATSALVSAFHPLRTLA